MAHSRNKDKDGKDFPNETVRKVWEKGKEIPGRDKDTVRKDTCNTIIYRSLYGKENGGWEIDHIKPKAKGGSDHMDNLQPLFWETNRDKSDTYPWSCPK